MTKLKLSLTVSLLLASVAAQAAVSPEEAKKLGTTLTAVGAEKAGNAAGTIPAYAGPLPASKYPSDYKPGSGRWINPYKDEKPLYTVTAANMAQYDAVLNEGAKALLKRFPDYQMPVYPSHRDAGFPQYWLDKSIKNATTVKVVGNDGDGIEGGWGGVPFPIPKSGWEAIWNYRTRYYPKLELRASNTYMMDAAGNRTLIASTTTFYDSMWSDPGAKPGPWIVKYSNAVLAPARNAGMLILRWDPVNYASDDQPSWAYTPGQRRVRQTPEAKYDNPSASYGGILLQDEISLFDGRMDRFDWKLVGKREMLIPYHTYDFDYNLPPEKVMGPKHPNPDTMRFELHRVWVVEATLKKGARHAYSKRRLYLDEDSWQMVATEAWDLGGNLYRVAYQNLAPMYGSTPYPWASTATYYDFNKGNWAHSTNSGGSPKSGYYIHDKFPPNVIPFTPEGLSGYGIR